MLKHTHIFRVILEEVWASLVAQRLKHLPRMRETQVWSLGQEDPPEKEMATHSNTLVWRIPWREKPGRLLSKGLQRVGHDWATSLYFFTWGSNGATVQQWIVDFTVLNCCLVLSRVLSGVAGRGKKVCRKGWLNMPEKELMRHGP